MFQEELVSVPEVLWTVDYKFGLFMSKGPQIVDSVCFKICKSGLQEWTVLVPEGSWMWIVSV